MDPLDIARCIYDALEEKQGRDIIVLDVEDLVGYTSYFVLVSGGSDRQVQALVEHVRRHVRAELNIRPLGIEGAQKGKWALVDFADVVVHVFREDERDFYDLEGLWRDAPQVEFDAADAAESQDP